MVDDLEVREESMEGNEHQSDHRVILFRMNLKPATILDTKGILQLLQYSIFLCYDHFYEKCQLEVWTMKMWRDHGI